MLELPRKKRVLIFCAHPDDDTFGMGASIAEMSRNGCKVTCIFLTLSPRAVLGDMPEQEKKDIRIKEAMEACRILGAESVFLDFHKDELEEPGTLEKITDLTSKLRPDIIFLLPGNDVHPTHRLSSHLVQEAVKEGDVNEIWFYETWTLLPEPNSVYFFGEKEMKLKKKAMRKHESQLERGGPTDEAFSCLNRFRSITIREPMMGFGEKHKEFGRYAEVFLVLRREEGK